MIFDNRKTGMYVKEARSDSAFLLPWRGGLTELEEHIAC